jgi:hypothetical protein
MPSNRIQILSKFLYNLKYSRGLPVQIITGWDRYNRCGEPIELYSECSWVFGISSMKIVYTPTDTNIAISNWDRDREITTKRELFHGLEWADGRVMHQSVVSSWCQSAGGEREDVKLPWKTTETIVITMLCYILPATEFQVVFVSMSQIVACDIFGFTHS